MASQGAGEGGKERQADRREARPILKWWRVRPWGWPPSRNGGRLPLLFALSRLGGPSRWWFQMVGWTGAGE